jgi:quercetin dioxygenase-like cupin family protein
MHFDISQETPMNRTVVMLTVAVAVGIALGLAGSHVLNAQQELVKRTVLIRSDLADIEGKEAVLFLAELAPGAIGGKHYHPGTELFYVLDGVFTHEPEGKPAVTLKMGEAGHNPTKGVHYIKNASMTEPTRVLGCLIADKGQPLTMPVQ